MKKSIITFALVIVSILCLLSIAVFGIRVWGIPGVFDEGGIRLGLDLAGGSAILYEADTNETPSRDEINSAVAMIQGRLDMLNYSEATVAASGINQILVEIPGISDPEEAVKMLGANAVLEFRDSDGNIVMDGKDIESAVASFGDARGYGNEYFISLKLRPEAVSKWAEATRIAAAKSSTSENYIAIYLDDNLMMRPSVEKELNTDSCMITGGYDRAGAEYYAGIISAGQLPFALKDVQLTATGPMLGEKSLETSLIAGLIGIILVMIFMTVYYRLPGFIASIALVAYIAIIGVTLVITQANLSLPGIAGIILSVGMAVDANVIIFERVKEELRSGKTIKASVSGGFHRAFTAIVDSNITTLIAAVVLWIFGSGPIIGFAVTLFMGVIISMFTAITVTRWLLNQIVRMNITNGRLYGL
ncbi:MAG: protein translocase subunit SecD [Oscillospiraceae bacterium]|nr:protein translocase subunit SecD [Oscillospiraceae bacterium]